MDVKFGNLRAQQFGEDRLDYLMAMSKEFMNEDELKVLKKVFKGQVSLNDPFKINYTPNQVEKEAKGCQTKLSNWKEPFN